MQQCTQLTSTNRPIGLIQTSRRIPLLRIEVTYTQCVQTQTNQRQSRVLSWQTPFHTGKAPVRLQRFCQRQKPAEILTGLVDIARAIHPIPSRTRPLSAAAPMVLRLKTWESRSPPNLSIPPPLSYDVSPFKRHPAATQGAFCVRSAFMR